MPPTNGREGPIWDPHDVHCHGSARSERVRSDVFWSESKSGCSDPNGLRSELVVGVRVIADRGGSWETIFAHAEEDVDTHSNQGGYYRLRLEVRDEFPSDCIFLVVQGKDDLGGVMGMFYWGVTWEELIHNKEDEVQEWMELDCLVVTGAIGVFK